MTSSPSPSCAAITPTSPCKLLGWPHAAYAGLDPHEPGTPGMFFPTEAAANAYLDGLYLLHGRALSANRASAMSSGSWYINFWWSPWYIRFRMTRPMNVTVFDGGGKFHQELQQWEGVSLVSYHDIDWHRRTFRVDLDHWGPIIGEVPFEMATRLRWKDVPIGGKECQRIDEREQPICLPDRPTRRAATTTSPWDAL